MEPPDRENLSSAGEAWPLNQGWFAAPQSPAPRVLHIEDDPLWADAAARLLHKWPEVAHIGTATNGRDGINRCRDLRPAVVLLDLVLSDISGFEVWEYLKAMSQRPKILLLTCRTDEVLLHHLVLGEAEGLIWKQSNFADFLRPALAAIVAGSSYFPSGVARALQQFRSSPNAFYKILSPLELRLVSLLVRGWRDEYIAEQIGRSPGTIRNHWHIITRKLGLRDRHDLRIWAETKGFWA